MKIGRITGNVLKRSLLQQIRTKRDEVLIGAGLGEDCAVFDLSAGQEMRDMKNVPDGREGTTFQKHDARVMFSCAQESFLSPEIRVSHLIQRCANMIAAGGGELFAVELQFLLPEEAEEEVLRVAMTDAEAICESLRVQIAGAGGRVAKEVTAPYATVTGYGVRGSSVDGDSTGEDHVDDAGDFDAVGTKVSVVSIKTVKPGQDIVLSKWIGLEGTAILAKRNREMLMERYPAWLVEEAAGFDRFLSTVEEAAIAAGSGVYAMRNVAEGGIYAALWELAEDAGVGLTVELKKIPIRQETVEVCNHCGINPYELLSGGCLLMTCEDGERLAEALEGSGIPAAVIGKITDSNDRLILNDDEVRYLDRPAPDGVYVQVASDAVI